MHKLFLVYFVNLYMFRAYLVPSSGGKTVCIQLLYYITLYYIILYYIILYYIILYYIILYYIILYYIILYYIILTWGFGLDLIIWGCFVKWSAFVNTGMKLKFPYVTDIATLNFTERTWIIQVWIHLERYSKSHLFLRGWWEVTRFKLTAHMDYAI